jgi:hypothetical protein
MTPDQIAAQRKVAQAMIERGSDYSPIQSGWQGAARVAQALMGGLESFEADKASKANSDAEAKLLASAFGGAPPAAPAAPVGDGVAKVAAASGGSPYAPAIAAVESGGKYDALGPVTKTGDRAYGKYQVMGANIAPWTKQYLGKEMTADEFLRSPEAQDAVFNGQFGSYVNKFGPEGASRAWFAGEKGMNNPNAKDALGTTVDGYAKKFMSNLPPAQVASLGPVALPQQPAADVAAVPQPAPATPQAAPAGVNPRLLQAMASPYISDGTKRVLGLMLQKQMDQDKVTTVDLGNKVGIMDARGNLVRSIDKGEPNKGPSFGDTGEIDPQTGQPIKGWIDPRDKSVTPYRPQPQTPAQPSNIPPVPPGVDPKVWRETQSKAAAANALPGNFDDTAKLRGEFTNLPAYKNMAQAAPIYQSMADAAGRNTKAADLNMVYGLGKIMDPGSVVREGEIQMANNAQGWQEKLNGIIAQINNEGGLTPQGRQALMAEAYSRMMAYKQQYDQDRGRFEGIAGRNRINPADVVPDFGEFKPWEAPKPAAAPQAAAPAAPNIDPAALAEARRRGLIK